MKRALLLKAGQVLAPDAFLLVLESESNKGLIIYITSVAGQTVYRAWLVTSHSASFFIICSFVVCVDSGKSTTRTGWVKKSKLSILSEYVNKTEKIGGM